MSLWRKEASKQLPEFQKIISSRDVDNPMMLWIELQYRFQDLCEQESPPLDLIRRMWGYAKWCMECGNDDMATAAALGFCDIFWIGKQRKMFFPQIMSRRDYEDLRALLLYHNSEEDFARGLSLFRS